MFFCCAYAFRSAFQKKLLRNLLDLKHNGKCNGIHTDCHDGVAPFFIGASAPEVPNEKPPGAPNACLSRCATRCDCTGSLDRVVRPEPSSSRPELCSYRTVLVRYLGRRAAYQEDA